MFTLIDSTQFTDFYEIKYRDPFLSNNFKILIVSYLKGIILIVLLFVSEKRRNFIKKSTLFFRD